MAQEIAEIPDLVRERLGERAGGSRGLMPGLFIDVEVDDSVRDDADLATRLEEACPVDIFAAARRAGSRSSRRTSTSACCARCAWTPPRPGTVRVVKLYDDGAAL